MFEVISRGPFYGLKAVVQYRRRDDGIKWYNMAAFDLRTAADKYCADCMASVSPWEYQVIDVPERSEDQ